MWELIKSLGPINQVGAGIGLIAGLAACVMVIVLAPVFGTIFVVLFWIVFLAGMWLGFGPQIRRNRLLGRGVRAQATVIDIRETGFTVQTNYGVAKLRLKVEPPDGEPYEVTTKALVNRFDIPAFQPGSRLEVVIDPARRGRVAVV
jgi:uncharacterized protein (DUF58 family)